MKNKIKTLLCLLLCLIMGLSVAACNDDPEVPPDDGGTTVTDPETPSGEEEIVPPELAELLQDEYAQANRGDTPEVPRYPEDKEWDMLVEKQQPLEVGESFTETFDGTYYTSRLSAVSDGAGFEVFEGEDAIDGKSLRITTDGDYAGIRLTGAGFVAGGTYSVEMDYNVITPSNDFFFQFRDSTVGAASDVFATFGSAAGEGKLTHTFTLGMYSNYYIMIMPRNNAGEVVIDNIKITREDSKPIASGLSLAGDMAVGGTLTASYTYTDYENDPEGASVFEWFAALSPTGMNKVILENTGKTLQVTEDMLGKYIGFQVTPVASQGDNAVGAPVLYMATETVGGTRPDYGETFSLGYGESFTEDFEADVGEDKNLVFVPHGNTDDYIYYDEDRASNVLRIKSDGSYLGTDFSGISFAARGIYRISFSYAYKTVPNTFYVQLRATGSDQFFQLPTEQGANVWKTAEGTLELLNVNDAFLMMFPDSSPVEILIDDLKIERLSAEGIGQNETFDMSTRAVSEDFESLMERQLYPEGKDAEVEVTEATGKSIDALTVRAVSENGGDVVMKGAAAHAEESFIVKFDYSVLAGEALSVGFTAADGTEGTFVPVEDLAAGVRTASVRVAAPAGEKEYFLTFRLGAGAEVLIDNISTSWIDPDVPSDYESFEGAEVYARSAYGGAETEVVSTSAGNRLQVTAPAGGGVSFAFGGVENGKTYAVSFTYTVTGGNGLSVRIGESGTPAAVAGTEGRATVYVTASGDGAAVIVTSSAACTFTLDDVFIQNDTRTEGAMNEPGETSSLPVSDASGVWHMDVNNTSNVSFSNDAAYQSALTSGYVLLVESKGAYGGVQIRNDTWDYDAAATYKITMTYTVTANPGGCEMYVQLGATSVNTQFNGDNTAVGVQKTVEFELTANAAWDCVMIFGGGNANGFTFTIDDFNMVRV